MTQQTSRIKGMYDVLPENIWVWQRLEKTVSQVFDNYGFHEIRFPVLEKTKLFHSAIGQSTDVVEKEMFSFESRSGSSLSLRPEGTAGCVRAVIQNDLCNRGQTQKLWYHGPMFRYERPQKGRNRQFYQIGAEIFGFDNPQADAELILMSAKLWKVLSLPGIRLEINSLGEHGERKQYREDLIKYFQEHNDVLDEDASRRLHSNPMRILDSKNPKMKDVIQKAPVLSDYLSEDSQQHFDQVLSILDACGIKYTVNPKLVRGLDYYSKTVFEWITEDLGAQGTICAGGRYDSLVEMQGGKPTPAVGFAMGVDRIVELIQDLKLWDRAEIYDVVVIIDNNIESTKSMKVVEDIRKVLPHLKVYAPIQPGSFKSQFKKADKFGAEYALILGEEELTENRLTLKSLVDRDFGQKPVTIDQLSEWICGDK